MPSDEPSLLPSDEPSVRPSDEPSLLPSDEPSVRPSDEPSLLPSDEPSVRPSDEPTLLPSDEPSVMTSDEPTLLPSDEPSVRPSDEPTLLPSDEPSVMPLDEPSLLPSDEPSLRPTDEPSLLPSDEPSLRPSEDPSLLPSDEPSVMPSNEPSSFPSKCIDEEDWFVGGMSDYSGLYCHNITTHLGYCDVIMGILDHGNFGKVVNEACCSCGGSTVKTTYPSTSIIPTTSPVPSIDVFPSSQPSACIDEPEWYFNATHELGCAIIALDLHPNAKCEHFSKIEYRGKVTYDACCVCGGGIHHSTNPSKSPFSEEPSSNPTECLDEEEWTVGGITDYKGLTCSQITIPNKSTDWCEAIMAQTDHINFGKSVNEACCVCGGGTFKTTHPSSEPSTPPSLSFIPTIEPMPSSQPSTCIDEPNWYFNVTHNLGCASIKESEADFICVQFKGIDYGGKTIIDACCICGGGKHQSRQPSDAPSTSQIPSLLLTASVQPSDQPSEFPSSEPSKSMRPSAFPSFSSGRIFDTKPCRYSQDCKSSVCTEEGLCAAGVSSMSQNLCCICIYIFLRF